MNLVLQRAFENANATIGKLFLGDELLCYTLEDEGRAVKVKGETRIPAGTYNIDFRKVDTPMTQSYKKRFNWFTYHLHVQNVPEFEYIYIHIGNTDKDTEGCILVGNKAYANSMTIGESAIAYEELYLLIKKELEEGKKVTITIKNI